MHIFEKPDNLVELIENSLEKYPDNKMFGTKNKDGEYEWITYREVGERIDNLRGGLGQAGIEKGDAVGIIANNRKEWAIAAYATFGLGGRYIPMYEKELVKIWKHIINDGGIKLLLVATREIYDQIEAMREELPGLEKVYLIEGEGENTMSGLEKIGAASPVASIRPKPEDIAVLIYTSGTTGDPKGVLLSHGNFTSNVLAGHKVFPGLNENDSGLSILPWAHSFRADRRAIPLLPYRRIDWIYGRCDNTGR
jgi:long-chain acyl-CoA synthetase